MCMLCDPAEMMPKIIVTAACGVGVLLMVVGYVLLLRKGYGHGKLRMWKGTVAREKRSLYSATPQRHFGAVGWAI